MAPEPSPMHVDVDKKKLIQYIDADESDIEDAELSTEEKNMLSVLQEAYNKLYKATRNNWSDDPAFALADVPEGVKPPASFTIDFLKTRLDPNQWSAWVSEHKKHSGLCALLVPFMAGYDDGRNATTAVLMAEAVARYNDSELPDVIAPTRAEGKGYAKFSPPWVYFLKTKHPRDTANILDKGICSCEKVSFMALPFNLALPTHICTVEGLRSSNPEGNLESIQSLVVQNLLDRESEITNSLNLFGAAVSPRFPLANWPAVIADELRLELFVEEDERATHTYINLYWKHPFSSPAQMNTWADVLVPPKHGINLGMYGTLRRKAVPFWCCICLSGEHTATRCPYPRIPGWRGLSALEYIESAGRRDNHMSATQQNVNSNNTGNNGWSTVNRSNRGRGNFRGAPSSRGGRGGGGARGGFGGARRGRGRGGGTAFQNSSGSWAADPNGW